MPQTDYETLRTFPFDAVKARIRSGDYCGHTAGFAPGNLQANLAVLGDGYADDFLEFCKANPRPCPLVGVSERGNPMLRDLGDVDIRTDIPSYNIYRNGVLEAQRPQITDLWSDDMVAFALGCSFTFEEALTDAGIKMKHIEQNQTVPMYATNIPLKPVGPFSGGMVVSMRSVPHGQVDLAIEITSNYPHAHGAPVHVGDPAEIGIADLDQPDWSDAITLEDNEVPMFWACGVTPQNVLLKAAPPLCITHTPGRMLVTGITDADVRQRSISGSLDRS